MVVTLDAHHAPAYLRIGDRFDVEGNERTVEHVASGARYALAAAQSLE